MECPGPPDISAFSVTRMIARKLASAFTQGGVRDGGGERESNTLLNLGNLHSTTASKDGENKI